MEIRRASADDAEAVAEIFVRSFGTLTFLPRLHSDEDQRRFIRNVVLPNEEVWVAEREGEIVGFASVSRRNGDDYLQHLYVAPEHQGRGVGDALLAQVKLRRPRGFRFWVFQANDHARRFYERRGCRVLELTDGSGNEEKTPDALYEWRP